MPSYTGPVFAHALQTLKGWFKLTSLDKSAPANQYVAAALANVPAGRVAAIDSSGTVALVIPSGSINGTVVAATQMPLYLWQGAADLDVMKTGTYDSKKYWVNTVPSGVLTGLVATGGYELQTTEFNPSGTYTPNRLLTVNSATSLAEAGILTNTAGNGNVGSVWVCGVCSLHCQIPWDSNSQTPTSPVGTNAHGVSVLSFWTYFLPKNGSI